MSNNFDLSEVIAIERETLASLGIESPGNAPFKEIVAQELYKAWVADNSDMRLLTYSFTRIQSLMVKFVVRLQATRLEEQEVFNTLCVQLLQALPKYRPERGRIFTFVTLTMNFRILDLCRTKGEPEPLEDWDCPTDDGAFHALEDFKAFLCKLANEQGQTANKMLRALIEILHGTDATVEYGQSQERIRMGIAAKTGLPRAIVDPYYNRLLTRWQHAVLD